MTIKTVRDRFNTLFENNNNKTLAEFLIKLNYGDGKLFFRLLHELPIDKLNQVLDRILKERLFILAYFSGNKPNIERVLIRLSITVDCLTYNNCLEYENNAFVSLIRLEWCIHAIRFVISKKTAHNDKTA